jgi:phosphate transport system permease protein
VTDTESTMRTQDPPTLVPADPAAVDPTLSPVHDEGGPTRFAVPVVAHRVTVHGAPAPEPAPERARGVKLARISRTGDRLFAALTGGTGVLLVLLVLFVGVFLLALALPSILADQDNFLTSRRWQVSGGDLRFGILGLLWTTVLSSVVAMVLAVPVAVGVALCLTQYLHRRVAGPIGFLVDLLAAVPSIIFGLARSWLRSVPGCPRRSASCRSSRRSPTRRARSSPPAWCWRS